jgi:hypothetical protein
MNEILHANVFFIIASLATLVFTMFVSVILYQIYKLVRTLRRILERIELGSEQMAIDLQHARQMLAGGGMLGRVLGFFAGRNRRD